ncbi:SpoIID/LytB domain-containing protein [Jatrophihabitans sp.]|uniref:SpoIID/LytB domain-containing protein n=1 Tax=Jatrophihabitans sp. TaxID=1932789 RepID=UPI0030C6E9EC|nr:SpoIID/LytB protein [Jatrophihabitans sp.]
MRPRGLIALLGCTALTAACLAVPVTAQATAVETATFPASGSVSFHVNGNGHGHGLSQYGAQGAAIAGLTSTQILAFYYPHTTLTTLAPSTIRVLLSSTTALTTVAAGTTGLAVGGFTLPTTGYQEFRLQPSASGLVVTGQKSAGGAFTAVPNAPALPAKADFTSTAGFVRALFANGTWTRYHGSVGAVRTSSTSEETINRVSLDQYTQGVVPREMPASWRTAAVQAQAVAVRSYAKSEMAAHASSNYDICDTSSCQVYGGYQHIEANGDLIWQDDPAAIVGNQNQVLLYQGAPVFAQFSASNGGATVDGGKPYLVAKVDPYDDAASGDPYLDRPDSVPVSSVASSYGLKAISSIQITKRDGLGQWGGRVLTANVIGTTSSGASKTIATDGFTLSYALGAATDWFHFDLPPLPAAPTSVKVAAGNAGATISWAAPANATAAGVSSYRISFGGHVVTTAASARSVYVAPIYQNARETVAVAAVGAAGAGASASVAVQGVPAPQGIVPITPLRLFNTGNPVVPVDPTHPFSYDLAGHLPSTATAAQLVVGVIHASQAGVLTVSTSGVVPSRVAAIAYSANDYAAATVSIPLVPSTTLVFTPSAGSVTVVAGAMSYSASTGGAVSMVAPTVLSSLSAVPTGAGATVSLATVPGIGATTRGVVLQVDGAARAKSGWLRIWGDSSTVPAVEQVAVAPGGANVNTIVVPVTSSLRLRWAASTASMSGRLTVIGLVGATGGRLETFPVNTTADNTNPTHPAVQVGTAAVTVPVTVGQVLRAGAAHLLAEITVSARGAGSLYAYPAGGSRPAVPNVVFSGAGSQTSTMLVTIGTGGAIALVSSVPGTTVSIDSLGYLTSG